MVVSTPQGETTWDKTHVVGIPPEAGLQASPSLYEVAAPSCVGEKANVPLPHPSLLAHVAPNSVGAESLNLTTLAEKEKTSLKAPYCITFHSIIDHMSTKCM